MASARNQTDPLPQTESNIALFQMMMHYKQVSDHLERENATLRACNSMLVAQNDVHRTENRELAGRNIQLINGSEIVVRSLDGLYGLIRNVELSTQPIADYRDEVMRIMMRGDVGFAILQGAPFVDLTTDTELDDSETESDTETAWI